MDNEWLEQLLYVESGRLSQHESIYFQYPIYFFNESTVLTQNDQLPFFVTAIKKNNELMKEDRIEVQSSGQIGMGFERTKIETILHAQLAQITQLTRR